jgi:(E)-4-hydroxy-3-methylbut-2-enyl-diphosphate synthase
LPYNPFEYKRRETFAVDNIGGSQVPVVIADLSKLQTISPKDLESIGYQYDEALDKWNISDTAADYVFTGHHILNFALPGTLKVIVYPAAWMQAEDKEKYFPIYDQRAYAEGEVKSNTLNFVMVDCFPEAIPYLSDMEYLNQIGNDPTVVLCLSSTNKNAMQSVRRMFIELMNRGV